MFARAVARERTGAAQVKAARAHSAEHVGQLAGVARPKG